MATKIAVLTEARRRAVFGSFTFCEMGEGRIRISPHWVEENLTQCRLLKANGKGEDVVTTCHRLAKEPLQEAFAELAHSGLWRLIRSFDGLWVPRHMTWNPRRPLSSHSWGIAFDLNAATNPYGGEVSPENRALNEVFNRYGFAWGGNWKGAKDGMHWELAALEASKRARESRQPRLILAVQREEGFSYHALPQATLQGGQFAVNPAQVAQALNARLSPNSSLPDDAPLRRVLKALGAEVIKLGDHQRDAHDPRYYVFVRMMEGKEPFAMNELTEFKSSR